MNSRLSMLPLLFVFTFSPLAFAQSAAARYEADKKLCAEESTSKLRMQCLRDARAEYDKAKASGSPESVKGTPTKDACADCGRVESIRTGEKKGDGSALGVIGGGVAGALIGSQIGSGRGKTLATVAGAAGGAYAGNKIEEHVKSSQYWSVRVRMDGGGERTVTFDHDPGLREGDPVSVSGNTIHRR